MNEHRCANKYYKMPVKSKNYLKTCYEKITNE